MWYRKRKWAVLFIAGLLVTGTSLLSAQAANAAALPSADQLTALAIEASNYAQQYPTTFGGVIVKPSAGRVVVELTVAAKGELSGLDEAVADPGVLQISHVTQSLGALTSDMARIAGSRQALAAQGIQLDKVDVDEAANAVTVGLPPGSPAGAVQELRARYPGVPLRIQWVREEAASGVADYQSGPPWMPGLDLYDLYYSGYTLYYTECSEGFNMVEPGTDHVYVTTASHCFSPGDTILHSTGSTGQYVGTVTSSGGFGSTADTALITPDVADTPNTVLVDNSTELSVYGYYNTTDVGTSLCKSGITTGQTCGNVVQSADATVCYSSGCFYDQEETANSSLAEVAYYGDSGGPVYAYDGSNAVIAAGNVSGFEETCTASGADCEPDGVMFFTPIGNVASDLGVVP